MNDRDHRCGKGLPTAAIDAIDYVYHARVCLQNGSKLIDFVRISPFAGEPLAKLPFEIA